MTGAPEIVVFGTTALLNASVSESASKHGSQEIQRAGSTRTRCCRQRPFSRPAAIPSNRRRRHFATKFRGRPCGALNEQEPRAGFPDPLADDFPTAQRETSSSFMPEMRHADGRQAAANRLGPQLPADDSKNGQRQKPQNYDDARCRNEKQLRETFPFLPMPGDFAFGVPSHFPSVPVFRTMFIPKSRPTVNQAHEGAGFTAGPSNTCGNPDQVT